jgi:glycosyltransferase involved in cell wall biosynthesis
MNSPLRIALISEHASPLAALGGTDAGGQNVYVAHVARNLARCGHEVDVLTRREARDQRSIVEVEPRLRVLHIPAGPATQVPKEELLPYMAEFTAATVQIFRHSPPYDVVHANFFMSGLVGLRLKTLLDVPLVVTFHALGLVRREFQGNADTFPPERIAIERRIVWAADRIVAECPQDEADLRRLYAARPERLAMVPCGVDLTEFRPGAKARARRRIGLSNDEFVVLQLGRLVPRKGVDNVIRAVAQLDRKCPVRLLVVGGNSADPDPALTPEIGRLRAIARECGVADSVTFTGQRQCKALRDFYLAADVFVSTPWYEPFGITPLEAMACGVPVIGSAVGGIQYSVADGSTGFLVPPRDPQILAARLRQLRDDPVLCKTLGRAGTERVRARFTWDRITAQLLEVYRSVSRKPADSIIPAAADVAPALTQAPAGLSLTLPRYRHASGRVHEAG